MGVSASRETRHSRLTVCVHTNRPSETSDCRSIIIILLTPARTRQFRNVCVRRRLPAGIHRMFSATNDSIDHQRCRHGLRLETSALFLRALPFDMGMNF